MSASVAVAIVPTWPAITCEGCLRLQLLTISTTQSVTFS